MNLFNGISKCKKCQNIFIEHDLEGICNECLDVAKKDIKKKLPTWEDVRGILND